MIPEFSLGDLLGTGLSVREGSFWFPPDVSNHAAKVDFTFELTFWICFVFFAGIMLALAYFCIKYRARDGHKEEETPTHSVRLETAWTVIPMLLMLVIFFVATSVYLDMRAPTPANETHIINVVGKQWAFDFIYPEGITHYELHVIKDQKTELLMTSQDVLHSMFIPAFRIKQDMVPNRFTLWFTPTKAADGDESQRKENGEGDGVYGYRLYCAEYCGKDHSNMITWCVVHETRASYMAWVKAVKLVEETMPLPEYGAVIYKRTCSPCHSLDGTIKVGPSFKGLWGKREKLADGSSVLVDENYVSRSITDPRADIVAGFENATMPAQNLKPRQILAIIEFLKNPKKFQRLGGRIPRGVLLVGVPGCGKTLLAKAIAGEAEVPFFSISGSDFVEMFVGVGASRVRDLFKQAKESSPCIIFLDEIDAVGRRRGASFGGGGHDEREQTLNAILVEMDGFGTSDQVIVVAATNRMDILDPALIRPGRFDRQVHVPLPDVQGRYEILKVHARKIKMGPTVDLRLLARGTPMFNGADLAAIVNEAALLATMENKEYVEQDDFDEARDKVRWGRAQKSRKVDENDQKVIAYHEAGHAIVQALEKHADPLHKVSIIPRGTMGGATFSLPERDRLVFTMSYLLATLKVTLGGRVAEEIYCGEMSSGAQSDIEQASSIARNMVTQWGMTESLGFIHYGEDRGGAFDIGMRNYSEDSASKIDREVKKIVDKAYEDTKSLLSEYRVQGEALAKALLKYETLSGDEVNAVIRGEPLDKPSVTDLLDGATPGSGVGKARPVSADSEPDVDMSGGDALPQPS